MGRIGGEGLKVRAISGALRAAALALLVAVAAGNGAAQKSGESAVQLHPRNPHYFLFRGKARAFVTSGEHYGAVINTDFDYKKYLATLEAEGLNYTRLFGGSYVEVPGKSFGILRNDLAPAPGKYIAPWARSGAAGYAGGGNKFDLEKWDEEYFTRLRDFLGGASEKGIAVEVSLFSSHYGEAQWNLSVFNAANNVNRTELADWKKLHTVENGTILGYQEKYVRKLVREVNGFDNLIFEIQNEPWSDRPAAAGVVGTVNGFLQPPGRDRFPNAAETADELSLAWQAKVVEWIRNEEAGRSQKHLIAQNYSNFRLPIRELIKGVSVVNFHYAYPEAASWNYGVGTAIAYDETGFMGRDDGGYRRQAWNFMMSGGGIFDALDYSFSAGHEDGTDMESNGPGGGSVELRKELRVLLEFLNSFELSELRPDAEVVKHAGGTVARALSNPGKEYGIYFDGDGPIKVELRLAPGKYASEWINVKTGRVEREKEFTSGKEETELESPAFENGMALRIKLVRD